MTLKESINHGYNLMVTVVLFFAGLAFGSVAASPTENDWTDRLDDIGLVLVGLIILIWFLVGRNRYQRSAVPLVLAGVALAVQALAIVFETDDPAAFGDNIGGLVLYAPFFVFALIYYFCTGRMLSGV